MNSKILNKILVALNEPEPKLDYIRGMVETLVSLMEDGKEVVAPSPKVGGIQTLPNTSTGNDLPPPPKFMNEIISQNKNV